jgi:hypothetical protein
MVKGKSAAVMLAGIIGVFGITTAVSAATAYPGYIFTASGQNAYLISPSGATVHTWKATGSAQSNADLLPDGSALFPIGTSCTVRGGGAFPHGRLQQINWDNQVVWDAVVCDATYMPGYDAEPIVKANGSFTVLVGGTSSSNGVKIVEVKPVPPSGKEFVWQYDLPANAIGSGVLNSLSFNPDLGDSGYIAVNFNGGKKISVIDKAKKSVVCTYSVTTGSVNHAVKWVTPYYSGTLIPTPDANKTAMRTNNLLVVNNSIQAIEYTCNTAGSTLTEVKKITYAFAAHEGSVQRLPNGNTFVQNGMQSPKITELDDNGTVVRTLNAPANVQRALMYGPGYPGLKNYTGIKTMTPVPAVAGKFTYNAAVGIGTVTIGGSDASMIDLRIFSLSGKTVYSSVSKGTTAEFSTGRLLAGVYYINVKHASGTIGAGFVKMQ